MANELAIEVTHRYDGVTIEDSAFSDLLDAVAWRRQPRFIARGRASREILTTPAFVTNKPEQPLKFAKIKGLGVYDPAKFGKHRDKILGEFSDEPRPPTSIPLGWSSTYPHIGFDKRGEYAIAYGSSAPVGGILHDRAYLEYRNAKLLLEHGIPTIVPLAVIRYKDKTFTDQPTGAVITLSPNPLSDRLSEVLYLASCRPGVNPDADDFYHRVLRSLDVDGDPNTETVRLEAVNILARKIGTVMRDFSMAGLYRHSSEWSNYEYDFDIKQPVFTDLDSTLLLGELTPEMQTLQVLRDFATVAYRLVAKFGTPTNLGVYTLTNILKYDPMLETLIGYFPETPKQTLNQISKKLWNAFIPHLFLLKRHRKHIEANEWSSDRRRSYKMSHDLFYVLTVSLLFPVFVQSELGRKYPSALTEDELLNRAERYLQERYEYFLYLLNAPVAP